MTLAACLRQVQASQVADVCVVCTFVSRRAHARMAPSLGNDNPNKVTLHQLFVSYNCARITCSERHLTPQFAPQSPEGLGLLLFQYGRLAQLEKQQPTNSDKFQHPTERIEDVLVRPQEETSCFGCLWGSCCLGPSEFASSPLCTKRLWFPNFPYD